MLGVDINATEFVILIVLAVIILGPQRLPEYAAKLAQAVRNLRGYAEGARSSLREQMGPEFDDIDWSQYDPRQYDPRRIVREALLDDDGRDVFGRQVGEPRHHPAGGFDVDEAPALPLSSQGNHRYDPQYTPFDIEAT